MLEVEDGRGAQAHCGRRTLSTTHFLAACTCLQAELGVTSILALQDPLGILRSD